MFSITFACLAYRKCLVWWRGTMIFSPRGQVLQPYQKLSKPPQHNLLYILLLCRLYVKKLNVSRMKSTMLPWKSHRMPQLKPRSFVLKRMLRHFWRWRRHVIQACPTFTNSWISQRKNTNLLSTICAHFEDRKMPNSMLATTLLWQRTELWYNCS